MAYNSSNKSGVSNSTNDAKNLNGSNKSENQYSNKTSNKTSNRTTDKTSNKTSNKSTNQASNKSDNKMTNRATDSADDCNYQYVFCIVAYDNRKQMVEISSIICFSISVFHYKNIIYRKKDLEIYA